MRVYADFREKSSGVPDLIRKLGATVIFDNLSVGDYVVGDGVLIERKSVSDYVKSIFDKRLFDQASRLKEASQEPILILEGSLEKAKRFVSNWNAVLGSLVSLTLDFGIKVMLSTGVEDTAYLIFKLAEKEGDVHKRQISLVEKPKISSLRQAQEFVVQSFPMIGPVYAKKLLMKFGSIKGICDADIAELQKVLGEKRGEELFKLIVAPYSPEKKEDQNKNKQNKGVTLEDFLSEPK